MPVDTAHSGMIQPDVLTVRIRKLVERDRHFVHKSFIKIGLAAQKQLHPGKYRRGRSLVPVRNRLVYQLESLRGRQATFLIACDPDDADLLMGWACAESTVLHFIYVKSPYRRQGIARSFIAELNLGDQQNLAYSMRNMMSEIIAEDHPGRLTYIGFD